MKDLYGQYAVDTFNLASIDGENKLITNEFEFVRGRSLDPRLVYLFNN
jgi:hypothetical protein